MFIDVRFQFMFMFFEVIIQLKVMFFDILFQFLFIFFEVVLFNLILYIRLRLYLLRLFHILRLCALILYFNWKLYELCQNWMQMRLANPSTSFKRLRSLRNVALCGVCGPSPGSCRRRRPTGNRGMPLMISLLLHLLLLLLLLLMLLLSGRLQQLQLNAN